MLGDWHSLIQRGETMVPIRYNLVDKSMYRYKSPYESTKDGICVHNTAMPSPASNEVSYMRRNTNEISFHVAVDEKEIVVGIPFDRNAWASGDGHGPGNMHKIHIEICRSTNENEELFKKAEQNAAEYIAVLLKSYNWGIDRVFKHQDFDGKYCPHKTLDWGWKRFLKMIESYMTKKEEEDEVFTYEQFKEYMGKYNAELENKKVSDWAKDSWDTCVEAKLLDGTKPQSPLTRQEFAIVLDRIEKSGEEDK